MMVSVQITSGEPVDEPVQLIERRLNGASWTILLIGICLLVCSIAQITYRLTLPTDGWSYVSGAIGSDMQDTITYHTNLIDQPSPLRPGDFLLAVEGISYRSLMSNAEALGLPLIDGWSTRISARYLVQRNGSAVELSVPLYHWQFENIAILAINSATFVRLLDLMIGLWVFLKRPRELAARILFFLSVTWLTIHISETVIWGLPEIIHPPIWLTAVIFSNWMYGCLAAPTVLLLALSFPRPKPFIRKHTLTVTLGVYSVLPILVLLFGPQAFLGWGWTAVCGLLSLVSIVHTLFTESDRVSRAQLRWAGLGFSGLALSILLSAIGGFGLYTLGIERLLMALDPFLQLAFPAALAVAILRYRLFDIDLILNRTLVYGTLTACVIGLYIMIVSYLGTLFRGEDDLIFSLIATGVIAVGFQPLREWLQRIVNRSMFGQRDEPYTVIATLGRKLEISQTPNDVFYSIVETIGQSLKLPFVAIELGGREQSRARYQFPPNAQSQSLESLLSLPLSYHNRSVGVLLIEARAGEKRFDQADHKLLNDLARQIGIAVYAAQMTADVQRSRERIVITREEERRRLRRDLHDGLGPILASQTLTLDVIARLIRSDPDHAAILLVAVREQIQQAVHDIRDLIYGLRPPVLDDLGLKGAMEEFTDHVRRQHRTPSIHLDLPTISRQLSAAVEVATYRIFQEALNNVIRHSQASVCEVRVEIKAEDDTGEKVHAPLLVLDVIDNGVGIAANRLSGVGLQSMRERSEELGGLLIIEAVPGGGTRIRAVLPITHTKKVPDDNNSDC